MKSKNKNEIITAYSIFMGHFSLLLLASVLLVGLFIETKKSFIDLVKAKKEELDLYKIKKIYLSNNVDSINFFIQILNTNMVTNEDALERKIIEIRNESINEIDSIEKLGVAHFSIYKKILFDIDNKLETIQSLRQIKEEENNLKNKLQNCNDANNKLKK